ncbi:MAG: aminotransferase, partial [Geminicoccaceae bacterium]|nr:aminotransferase [Geminicoccaceae bacterium]
LIHPFTNLAELADRPPLVIDRGDGAHVIDQHGRRLLEGMAGLWCASLGFSDQRLIDAASRQMATLPAYHLFGGKTYAPAVEVAERLLELCPGDMGRVLFTNSGSEANDTAVKIARYVWAARGQPARRKIISRVRAYHGVTLASASLTGLTHAHRDFGLPLQDFLHAECPHYYRFGLPGESEELFADRMARDLERLIQREGPETIAAFIAEPVMGAGGVIMPPQGYFERIQAVLRTYDILFIVDEVITGFARTGRLFGAETFALQPAITTLAKGLTAGYAPLGAVLVNQEIAADLERQSRKLGTFGHGFTFAGHPLSTAVARAALQAYVEDDIVGHVGRMAGHFADRLRELALHPLVGHARAVGLLGAIELMADGRQKVPFDPARKIGTRLVDLVLERGVILRPLGDVISFCPPLIVGEAEIDHLFDSVASALDKLAAEVSPAHTSRVA